jgi:hypothetical protein
MACDKSNVVVLDVFQILWSPDGRLVAALASNGVIVVWPFDQ